MGKFRVLFAIKSDLSKRGTGEIIKKSFPLQPNGRDISGYPPLDPHLPNGLDCPKSALLASAEAVNKHLESDKRDTWVNPLPHFHVGGLGILARTYLSGAMLHDFKADCPGKWAPQEFYRYIDR